MKLNEYFRKVKFDNIYAVLAEKHNNIDYDSLKLAYNELLSLNSKSTSLDSIKIEKLIETFYSVVGVEKDEEYAIEYTNWEELVSLNVDNSANNFSDEEVAAFLLYELTWAGNSKAEVDEAIDEFNYFSQNIDYDDYSIVKTKDLKTLLFQSYFNGDITTKFAAELLNIEIVDFVEIYEKWEN